MKTMGRSDSSNVYIRKALLLALVVLTAVFQHTRGAMPELFGTRAMLLIPLTVAISMYERSFYGLLYGALAGILWDFATVGGDGFFSVCLASVGFFTGSLVTYLMRNKLSGNLILSLCSVTSVNVAYWFVFILRKGYEGAGDVLFGYYLPSIIYTMLFAFVYYYLVGLIFRLTAKKEKRRTYVPPMSE